MKSWILVIPIEIEVSSYISAYKCNYDSICSDHLGAIVYSYIFYKTASTGRKENALEPIYIGMYYLGTPGQNGTVTSSKVLLRIP